MDRLIEAIEDKQNPSVVGLDPTEALVPKQVVASFAEEIAEQVEDPTEAPAAQLSVAFFEFNRAIIDGRVTDVFPEQNKSDSYLSISSGDFHLSDSQKDEDYGIYLNGQITRTV